MANPTIPRWQDILALHIHGAHRLHGDQISPTTPSLIDDLLAEEHRAAFGAALVVHAEACDTRMARFLGFLAGQDAAASEAAFGAALDAFQAAEDGQAAPRRVLH
jgi:hypothetical protein